MHKESPFNAIPMPVLGLVVVIVAVELVLTGAANGFAGGAQGIGWRAIATQDYAFAPAVLTEIFERGRGTFDMWKRFLTYTFIHQSLTHAVWTTVLVLAMGKYVGEILRPLSFLTLFFAASVGGAGIYGAMSPTNTPLLGAYPGVYGLIGAYTYLMWLTLGRLGENQLKAFQLIAVLMGLLVIYSMLFGSTPTWIAEVSGFIVGLFISPVLAPGGWAAFLARIRSRS